jgi:hypothetical protein
VIPVEFSRFHRLPRVACSGCDFARRVGGAGSICSLHEAMGTLGHNLAIGAALCRAFSHGAVYMGHAVLQAQGAKPIAEPFTPGCGKAAP